MKSIAIMRSLLYHEYMTQTWPKTFDFNAFGYINSLNKNVFSTVAQQLIWKCLKQCIFSIRSILLVLAWIWPQNDEATHRCRRSNKNNVQKKGAHADTQPKNFCWENDMVNEWKRVRAKAHKSYVRNKWNRWRKNTNTHTSTQAHKHTYIWSSSFPIFLKRMKRAENLKYWCTIHKRTCIENSCGNEKRARALYCVNACRNTGSLEMQLKTNMRERESDSFYAWKFWGTDNVLHHIL